jgi:amino acid transporter
MRSASAPTTSAAAPEHRLRKVLGLRDLVPMQILLVMGTSWTGTAAHQADAQLAFWLIGALLLFVPVAILVQYCVCIWPYEGGVYQWTKHAFGPFAGFISAWNLGAWVLLLVSTVGLQIANGISYALGPGAAWMAESRPLIWGMNVALFALMYLVNARGMRVGRWLSHLGTGAAMLVSVVLITLLFVHPQASAAHPHVSPQRPFSWQLPALTLISLNIFSKIAFNGYTALEQVAVFAGETRDAARSILRSAWIAAPIIATVYILITGTLLSYTPAKDVDLVNPFAQALASAFGTGGIGALLGNACIVATAIAIVAQAAMYVAETSRLPMVAGWDHIIPAWFTRLHPRHGTPTRSLAVIVVAALAFSFLASWQAGAGEAFQLLMTSAFVCYGVNYLLMFAVPLLAGTRWSRRPDLRPPPLVRIACAAGAVTTIISMIFNLVPIVDVADPARFSLEVGAAVVIINLAGAAIYWRGARAASASLVP